MAEIRLNRVEEQVKDHLRVLGLKHAWVEKRLVKKSHEFLCGFFLEVGLDQAEENLKTSEREFSLRESAEPEIPLEIVLHFADQGISLYVRLKDLVDSQQIQIYLFGLEFDLLPNKIP